MAIRMEVTADGTIEMIRIADGRAKFLRYESLDEAIEIARFLLRKDVCLARTERFKPQFAEECRTIMKQMLKEKR